MVLFDYGCESKVPDLILYPIIFFCVRLSQEHLVHAVLEQEVSRISYVRNRASSHDRNGRKEVSWRSDPVFEKIIDFSGFESIFTISRLFIPLSSRFPFLLSGCFSFFFSIIEVVDSDSLISRY